MPGSSCTSTLPPMAHVIKHSAMNHIELEELRKPFDKLQACQVTRVLSHDHTSAIT